MVESLKRSTTHTLFTLIFLRSVGRSIEAGYFKPVLHTMASTEPLANESVYIRF